MIDGISQIGSADPAMKWYFQNYDKYKVTWLQSTYVPSCRGPPNSGYGPEPGRNDYLNTQPEIMVLKDPDGPQRTDEGTFMDWDTMMRTKGVFYVSPVKAFKIGMRPRMLAGVGQWSGGSTTEAAKFRYVGHTPFSGWMDTQDVLISTLDKNPHQVGGWTIKTRPNGWQADIAYLIYTQVHILFAGRKKEQIPGSLNNPPGPHAIVIHSDKPALLPNTRVKPDELKEIFPTPTYPPNSVGVPPADPAHAMHALGAAAANIVKSGIIG